MSGRFSLDDYVDVAERIVAFKDKYPDGSLQTLSWEVCDVGGALFIVYHAAAYRHPLDVMPGQGIAWEPFPGQTPYTKNSELMNAETAAWGRAIVALGLTANRKLASKQEVRARQEEQAQPRKAEPQKREPLATDQDITAMATAVKGLTPRQMKLAFTECGLPQPAKLESLDDAITAFSKVPQSKAGELARTLAGVKR